uniref:Uncharacterized protein n=1 Tax=Oryza brachyantha TaxID=4533 RepID=J3LLA5_ORYBR
MSVLGSVVCAGSVVRLLSCNRLLRVSCRRCRRRCHCGCGCCACHCRWLCIGLLCYLSRVRWRICTVSSRLRSRLRHLMAVVISSIRRIRSLQSKQQLPIVGLMLQRSGAKLED